MLIVLEIAQASITHHKTHCIEIGCTQKIRHGSTTKKNLLINTIDMANPIGHLSHKEFKDLTVRERVEVIAAYNDCNRYPPNDPCPEGNLLKQFWDSWNY